MIVRPDLGLQVIVIPKVASSSIRGALAGTRGYDPDYYTAVFIRHPWDRLVSALYSVLRAFQPENERLAMYLERPVDDIDEHVRPQWTFLEGRRIDYVGRYETLTEDWRVLAERFDLPLLTPSNVGKYRPERWQEAPIDWKRWLPIYRRDFQLCPDWHSCPEPFVASVVSEAR